MALGAVLAVYFVSLLIRGPSQQVNLIDGWGVATFEFVASCLCLWRAVTSRRKTIPLLLGLGILSWSIGDAVLASESAGGATPAVPSLADLFYLGFYPIVYIALVLLTRKHLYRLGATTWLDGAVAGLGAAALCACFAFNTVLHSVGGDASAVATDLAYPIGDGLLLILAVGGTAIIPGRKKTQWLLHRGRDRPDRRRRYLQSLRELGSHLPRGDHLQQHRLAVRHPAHLDRGVGAPPAEEPDGSR